MRYVWDQVDAYWGRGFLRWIATPLIAYLRHFDTRYRDPESVTQFVAISSTVRARIQEHYGRGASIVYPPVDVDAFEDESPGPSPSDRSAYLLVGGFVPYKLESLAIEAFARSDRTLIIAGDGPTRAELERTAPDNVRFLGRVGDIELRTLYKECRALLYPQEEDFGIVAVEAQAAGRPVIAYGRGGARDTVVDFRDARGDDQADTPATGVYFAEQTPEALLAALDLFEANEAAIEPKRIREWSLQFGIERFRTSFQREVDKLLERPAL
jgi:glycosyltransferase involved in cell wall biosynthesis